jgi:hypothetical protein
MTNKQSPIGNSTGSSDAEQIDAIINSFPDWRGQMLVQIRALIKEADPEIIEEVKWKTPSNPQGIPVWSRYGMICTGETYKAHIRLSFAKGPNLHDPKGLINSYRAILIHETDTIDEAAFKTLIRAAVELNRQNQKK